MKSDIGLDTLHLNPVEFDLEPHFFPRRRFGDATPENENGVNYPLYRLGDRTFEGKRAYHNAPNFTFEMWPYTDRETGTFHVSTKVQLTVPKVARGDNYYTSNRDELKSALERVETDLADFGFRTDLKAALVCRCDIARTLQNQDTWATYCPVLDALKASRMAGTGFETGKRWGNSRRQICLYDKVEEICSRPKNKKRRAEIIATYPKNSMRAEVRLTERESFFETTGMKTVADMLSDFGHVQGVYRSELEQRLFNFSPGQVEKLTKDALSVEGLASDILNCIETTPRYWFEEWIRRDWATNRVLSSQRLNVMKEAIKIASEQAGLARPNVSRQQKKLDDLYFRYSDVERSTRTVADLYTELKSKMLSE